MKKKYLLFAVAFVVFLSGKLLAATAPELRLGLAQHAFDHLGELGDQADAAAKSGATIIYATGLGALGYQGLPTEKELSEKRQAVLAYNKQARKKGIQFVIGYVCATSIVKLDAFDKNWSSEFRSQFKTPPAEWRQIGRDGKPLPSWYGGDYQSACMNNPDWRAYEQFMVRQQLESDHDGIFFDNPTVHPQGCYCRHCMGRFAAFLHESGIEVPDFSLEAERKLTEKYPKEFLRFRCTIARDFLAEMRTLARSIKRDAVITCNNSLNSPDALYAQCRQYGYNIHEFSKAEDFIVVEDMASQPRALSNGNTMEYGPTYQQLNAINHGKPVVAVTIAEQDYHTPPNLVALALAEAAAHNASYLSWPTWPEKERERMISAVRPQMDFYRKNWTALNNASLRCDVIVFLPFRRWMETDKCAVSALAAELTRANIQYQILSEDDFARTVERESLRAVIPAPKTDVIVKKGDPANPERKLKRIAKASILPAVLIESDSVLNASEKSALDKFMVAGGKVIRGDEADWLKKIRNLSNPSITLEAPPTIRAVVHDQPRQTLVHLYNLNIERLSSFQDKVHPAQKIGVKVRAPFKEVRSIKLLSVNENLAAAPLPFKTSQRGNDTIVETTIPSLNVNAILVVQP